MVRKILFQLLKFLSPCIYKQIWLESRYVKLAITNDFLLKQIVINNQLSHNLFRISSICPYEEQLIRQKHFFYC